MPNGTLPELWKPIAGFEGIYEISNRGRVKSLARTVPHARNGSMRVPERMMALCLDAYGYPLVVLKAEGNAWTRKVHRLVAETFVPGQADDLEVMHLDGVKTNNDHRNLKWGSRAENIRDLVRHGGHGFASRTHCPRGHEYTNENTRRYVTKAGHNARFCRACDRERNVIRRAG